MVLRRGTRVQPDNTVYNNALVVELSDSRVHVVSPIHRESAIIRPTRHRPKDSSSTVASSPDHPTSLDPHSTSPCMNRTQPHYALTSAPPSTLRARGRGVTSLIRALTRSFSSLSADSASAGVQCSWATCQRLFVESTWSCLVRGPKEGGE